MCVVLSFLCGVVQIRKFQGGDKLTLALGQASTTTTNDSSPTSPNKLINLDSPTTSPSSQSAPPAKPAPPLPPPRTTSDPNYKAPAPNPPAESSPIQEEVPVSVTHFSTGLNGVEKETIFTDNHDAASIVRQHLGGSNNNNNTNSGNPFTPNKTNPFLNGDTNDDNAGERTENHMDKSLDEIVEQKIQDLINANPFTGKYNTIGRSNPFSSPNSSKNPFLDTRASNEKITSSGEDVNESPESSMEPIDGMEPPANANTIVSQDPKILANFQIFCMTRSMMSLRQFLKRHFNFSNFRLSSSLCYFFFYLPFSNPKSVNHVSANIVTGTLGGEDTILTTNW